MKTPYLWKRGESYSAVLDVPQSVQKQFGTKRFVQALKTKNASEANIRKLPYIAVWKAQIDAAIKGRTAPLLDVMAEALENRASYIVPDTREIGHGGHDSTNKEELHGTILDRAKEIEAVKGPHMAKTFVEVSTALASYMADNWPTWLEQAEVKPQTKAQHRAAVLRFLGWAGATETIEAVTRKRAGQYVNHLLATSGLSRRSVQRHCSSLSSLWIWYASRGFIEDDVNPWLGQKLGKRPKKRFRTGFSDEEIMTLLTPPANQKTIYQKALPDLIRFGLLTGARIEAICELKPENIERRDDGYWISVTGDKTEAGDRTFPLHSLGTPIMDRLLAQKGKYVFPGFLRGGKDMRRSRFPSREFLKHRNSLGVSGRGKDFHNFRATFSNCMEGNEVPETTVALIVGHKRESMTYGHYSSGKRLELRKQIQRLDYGPEVMAEIGRGA